MRYTTHVITGLAIGTTLVSTGLTPTPDFSEYGFTGLVNTLVFLSVLAVGSLLPDIDHSKSFISRKLGVSLPVGHRGITHTIYPYAFLIYLSLTGNIGHPDFVFWLSVGALLHMVGDMHTAGGVKLFGFGPSLTLFGPLSFKTGSLVEYIFFAGYAALLYFSLLSMGVV